MDVDLNACIQGRKHAWDRFVERYSGVIYAAVTRVMDRRGPGRGREDIEDAVQAVFIRLIRDDYRILRGYDPERAALSTWLTVIARNVAIDHLRRRRLDAVPLEAHDLPAGTPAVDREAEAEPVPLQILTSRQRLVLRLLFDDDLSVAEAARVLDVDEQTVRSTKHKALTRLREHFDSR